MTIAKQVLVSLVICLMLIMGCSETERETEPKSMEILLIILYLQAWMERSLEASPIPWHMQK
jgi:hypothetical protein